MLSITKGAWAVAILALMGVLLPGCGSASTGDNPSGAPTAVVSSSAPSTNPPSNPTGNPTGESSEATGGVNPILATTVLRVGEQRVAFLLAGPQGIIQDPTAQVTHVFLGSGADGTEAPAAASLAKFHLWPYGVRGSYSTQLLFDRPGRWRLDIETEGTAEPIRAQLEIDVAEESHIPDIGSLPPTGNNKTLDSVPGLEQLTTDYEPDPDLYSMTIDEAIASGMPAVIVFATPAFCSSPTCGPQVDTVSMLKDLRAPEANFIHVELYDNPAEIQGDLGRAELVPFAEDWGFTTIPDWSNESWVFVLDPKGRIHQRFEGYATLEELDSALAAASNPAS